jgi:hypothetical protein
LASPLAPFGAVTGGELTGRGRLRDVIILSPGLIKGEVSSHTLENTYRVFDPDLGVEVLLPIMFDAVEPDFTDDVHVSILEVHRGEIGLVLRRITSQSFFRLGVFSLPWDGNSEPQRDLIVRSRPWEMHLEHWLQNLSGSKETVVTIV